MGKASSNVASPKALLGCMSSARMGILDGRISGEFRPQMMVLGRFGLSIKDFAVIVGLLHGHIDLC
jgi:hypothetical protein